MARAKMYCQGKTSDGRHCSNWAIKGSYYCQLHQNQVTQKDMDNMSNVQTITKVIIIIGLIIAFLISVAGGCEKEFFKYLSK